MSYGYADCILRVDLSEMSIRKEPLSPNLKRDYLGGVGFGARILYDELKPHANALGPENVLVFATGPLNGTLAPGSGRLDITTKSPLTGMIGMANLGGFWAPELKYAGYDVLVVKGKAASPVYIWIENDKVELRTADHLWGKDTWDTADLIKRASQGRSLDRTRVLAIGPAGENLVRYAAIIHDYHHAAARSGTGAVMGSKNLKAIAVRGDGGIAIGDPQAFEEAARACIAKYPLYAHRGSVIVTIKDRFTYTGDLAGRHYQSAMLPHFEGLTSKFVKNYQGAMPHACHDCHVGEQ